MLNGVPKIALLTLALATALVIVLPSWETAVDAFFAVALVYVMTKR